MPVLLTMLLCDSMDSSPTPCFDPPPSLAPWLQQCHRMYQEKRSEHCFDFFPPWLSPFPGKWESCLYLRKEYYIVSYAQNLNLKLIAAEDIFTPYSTLLTFLFTYIFRSQEFHSPCNLVGEAQQIQQAEALGTVIWKKVFDFWIYWKMKKNVVLLWSVTVASIFPYLSWFWADNFSRIPWPKQSFSSNYYHF